mmetsp:Transcript_11070/g.27582  ORF Transcript_11070/g.27582 Transcript_11070/m.27582 type:complete len:86 (+) Transcript_11070:920-1177(+)
MSVCVPVAPTFEIRMHSAERAAFLRMSLRYFQCLWKLLAGEVATRQTTLLEHIQVVKIKLWGARARELCFAAHAWSARMPTNWPA